MARTLMLKGPEILELSRDFKAQGTRYLCRGRMLGSSMWPSLRSGDRIVVEHTPEKAIRPGDILVFGGFDKLVAHRLRRVRVDGQGRHYVTRGDFILRDDQEISYDAIAGRVTAIERGGRVICPAAPAQRLKTTLWLLFRPVLVPGLRRLSALAKRCSRTPGAGGRDAKSASNPKLS